MSPIDKRTALVRAAAKLILKHGAKGLSQAKVAAACGLKQGHLTYYFPTRVDLLRAVVEHVMGTLTQPALPLPLALRPDPAQVVDLLVTVACSSEQAKFTQALILMAQEDDSLGDLVRQFTREAEERLETVLHDTLGLRRGFGVSLHALLVGISTLALVLPPEDARARAHASIMEFLRHAKSTRS